ncbi:unnamed protein product [Paramecium octaurelia]|uniref:Mitochondrial carrier protein n=1 Tax=Paramecium octaurelia TaxID=43137 RepID=A0A8S1T4R6_PAROT|nr:unnamed protein product [Paramecium octaurelia]
MKQGDHLSSTTIIVSSGLASVISTIISNPFEVLKIRLQVDKMHCHEHQHQRNPHRSKPKFKYIHEIALTGQSTRHQLNHYGMLSKSLKLWRPHRMINVIGKSQATNPLIKIYQNCTCITTNSLVQAFQHIYAHEGASTFFNGWRYAVLQAGASNVCYFMFYERTRKFLQQLELPSSRLVVPLLASSFSRALTTTITFPLEYWKVLQSSTVGYSKLKNIQLGTQLHSAYLITIQRDILFSCIYWSLLENLKIELGKVLQELPNAVNLLSAMMASSVTATMTLPLDVVKTRKQVSTRSDLGQSGQMATMEILQSIYNEEGLKGLFKGYQPRIAKVTMHSGLVYMMYEYLKQLF